MQASYQKLTKQELDKRFRLAKNLMESCTVCPRKCWVNRLKGEKGFCEMGVKPKITSFHAHFGEESPLVGKFGSGTIFFSSCNLACTYCQNYDISHYRQGEEIKTESLADAMITLQNKGCHNINFVSPAIWVPQILEALTIARDKGLSIPLVYNSGGYDSVATLKLLEGIVDIYMPDLKYSDSSLAKKYSQVENYWEIAKMALTEMHKQVGDLSVDSSGLAKTGLLVRHLVLPHNVAGTEKVMQFLADLSQDTYVNIMDQYYPVYMANGAPEINRRITAKEYHYAIDIAREQGLHRFDKI